MPSRREYPGGAVVETLAGSMSTSSLNVVISGNAGWTFGAGGPFACVINQGFATEEKVLCSSLVGTTLTFSRGYDGTSPQNHQPGETISPCVTAFDLDEANFHTTSTSAAHGITGAFVGTVDLQTLSNKTLIAPIVADLSNMTHTHLNSAGGGVLRGTPVTPTFNASWAAYTTGSPAQPSYAVDGTGWLKLQGQIISTTSTTAPSTITGSNLTAPADGKPHTFLLWDLINATARRVDVTAAGGLLAQFSGGAGTVLSLDGVGWQT